ncbi:hypothetical protein ACVHNB_38025 [Streptomyces sp. YJ-C3]
MSASTVGRANGGGFQAYLVAAAGLWAEGAVLVAVAFVRDTGWAMSDLVVTLLLCAGLGAVAAAVFAGVYVLPSLLLARWAGRRLTGRTSWPWAVLGTALWLVPALGPWILLRILAGPQDTADMPVDAEDWFTPDTWAPSALLLFVIMLPPALLGHLALRRAEAGRPVALFGKTLGVGVLGCVGILVTGAVTYALG